MKVTTGEILLTLGTIVGLGIILAALYIFAPNLMDQIEAYVRSFFDLKITPKIPTT